jgi:FkbM family methyltransferase
MSYSFGGKLDRHAVRSICAHGIVCALEPVIKDVGAAGAMNKNFGYALINLGRRAFVGTPIQKLRITSVVYNKIFRSMYREGDATAEYKGVKLTLPTKDTAIVPSILGGYFESLELDLFAKAAERSTTVLDVGANIGLFSCVAGKALQSGGAIYAFEPIAENAKYFRQNLLNNHLTNVELIESAVGQEVGELSIFVSKESIATHSASSRHSQGSESVSVPMTSVDAFIRSRGIGHVDVIKIDVEGYDGFVLKGAVETIKNYRPTIFIEYDPVCLKECGFKPADFADLLFTTYDYCVRIDEVSQKALPMTKQALLALPVYSNENLIFTNQGGLIESLSVGRETV